MSFLLLLRGLCPKYADVWSLSSRFSEEGMEVMERLIYLFRKFNQLKVSNEEYACMKAINFLNQGESVKRRNQSCWRKDLRPRDWCGLCNPSAVVQIADICVRKFWKWWNAFAWLLLLPLNVDTKDSACAICTVGTYLKCSYQSVTERLVTFVWRTFGWPISYQLPMNFSPVIWKWHWCR